MENILDSLKVIEQHVDLRETGALFDHEKCSGVMKPFDNRVIAIHRMFDSE